MTQHSCFNHYGCPIHNPEQEKAKKAAKKLGERRTNYREKD
jgi:hypothetical protein